MKEKILMLNSLNTMPLNALLISKYFLNINLYFIPFHILIHSKSTFKCIWDNPLAVSDFPRDYGGWYLKVLYLFVCVYILFCFVFQLTHMHIYIIILIYITLYVHIHMCSSINFGQFYILLINLSLPSSSPTESLPVLNKSLMYILIFWCIFANLK